MELTSPTFADTERIPVRYTCDGEGCNPPLHISGVPPGAATLALIMEDRDVPREIAPDGIYDHWVLFNMPAATADIPESAHAASILSLHGRTSNGALRYTPPCPPTELAPLEHRYLFTLYALDCELGTPEGADKTDVLFGMQGHVLAIARLAGRYGRTQTPGM